MVPIIGRFVHFYPITARDHDDPKTGPMSLVPLAALVVALVDDQPILEVMPGPWQEHYLIDTRPGMFWPEGVSYSETPRMGYWTHIP